MSILSKPYFHSEEAAFAHLESVLWPAGPVCPHCGAMSRISRLKPNPEKRVRFGLHKCGECSKQFTVKIGTVFEHARIPLHKILQAVHLMVASKKGVSAHQLHRILEVQYRTAWFLSHRIREAMRSGKLPELGGIGKEVEVDETYFGAKQGETLRAKHTRGPASKRAVLALVERGGQAHTFHVERATKAEVGEIVRESVSREAALMTDESRLYTKLGTEFASHETVAHKIGEYVRGRAHTNTAENLFSVFKRGMNGVYQHCGEKHLHRYLAEFEFRYNNRVGLGVDDSERASRTLAGIRGKRLTYRRTN